MNIHELLNLSWSEIIKLKKNTLESIIIDFQYEYKRLRDKSFVSNVVHHLTTDFFAECENKEILIKWIEFVYKKSSLNTGGIPQKMLVAQYHVSSIDLSTIPCTGHDFTPWKMTGKLKDGVFVPMRKGGWVAEFEYPLNGLRY